jgi:replicative DNA helicase
MNCATFPADTLPPQNLEAERLLVSAMLNDPACIDDITSIINTDDLYFDHSKKLFAALSAMHAEGKPIDVATVFEELRRRKQADDMGGASVIAELHGLMPTGANALEHAGIIRDCATRRRVIHAAHEAIRDAMQGEPGGDVLTALEAKLFTIAAHGSTQEVSHIKPFVLEEITRLDKLGQDEAANRGIPTGLPGLDEINGGWRPALYAIGSRPSVGKSAQMLTSALAAASAGYPTLCISLEMSTDQLVQRKLAMMTGMNLSRLRENRRIDENEFTKLSPATMELMDMPLYVNTSANLTMPKLAAMVRRAVRRHGIRIVFLDYLQIVEHHRGRNEVEELQAISRGLKLLSMSCQIPIVALAQLNRDSTKRENEKPRISEFRGSGSIEQDADDAYLLWRLDDDVNAAVHRIGLAIEKQRNGPTGEIELAFRRSCVRFEEPGARW